MLNDLWLQIAIYVLALIMSITTIVFFVTKCRKTSLLYSFVAFQAIITVWLFRLIYLKVTIYFNGKFGIAYYYPTTFEVFEQEHYSQKYLIVCTAGLLWLIFCLLFTGSKILKNKYFIAGVICISPIAFNIPIYLEDVQNNYITPFYIFTICQYTYYAVGIIVLFLWSRKQSGNLRNQAVLLALSIILPIAVNFAQDYKRFIIITGGIVHDYDITPIGFVVTLIIIAIATYKYSFMDVVPVGLSKIVENISQAIVFVDSFNRLIYFNKALQNTFEITDTIKKYASFEAFVQSILPDVDYNGQQSDMLMALRDPSKCSYKGELSLSTKKHIDVEIQPLFKKNQIIGRVISFTDVTEHYQLLEEINRKNHELIMYANTVEELAVARERNRLARDLHDTIGHTMTSLIALLEVSSITCDKQDIKTHNKLREAIELARGGLNDIQRSISGLGPEKLENTSFISAVNKLVAEFKNSGTEIELTVNGTEKSMSYAKSEALYRACQESVTNSIRHGKASRIEVIIKFTNDTIKLFIVDNGIGCTDIKMGFGLQGMEQRLCAVGGKLRYGSDGEEGFNVSVEVPLQ